MEITDTTKRTVRVQLDKVDLVEYFSEKTGMENIDGFKIVLTDKDGVDYPLNKRINRLTLIGDNSGEK